MATGPLDRPRPAARWALALWLAALTSIIIACPAAPLQWPEDDGFDDHTVARVTSLAQFKALARSDKPGGITALKFVIVEFGRPNAQTVRFLDAGFYTFHDEWYWFRLLNGEGVPGSRERPIGGLGFPTIAAIREWARAKPKPPLSMRFVDDRLYSDFFYELAVRREPPVFGIGTVIQLPARADEHPRDELWGFELEYADAVDARALERFFAALRESLPPPIADRLHYVARSPTQIQLIERLRAAHHPLAPYLISYAELAIPGEVRVYNPGLIAGRLRKLPSDPAAATKLLTEGDSHAIWMLPGVPDDLPPAAGLLTAVAQTPLAHVNLLARNRGIPNAYLGGLFDDPQLDQLARVHAPIVLLAEADNTLILEPISDDAYREWLNMRRTRTPTLVQVELASVPYTLDLDLEPPERVPELRTIVGGKAAGFPILRAANVTMPERPLAVTIRPYAEHLAPLRPLIDEALRDPSFIRDARMRYLVLEGRAAFERRFRSEADRRWLARTRSKPALAQLIALDGIKHAIRNRPLDPAARRSIEAELRRHFGHFADTQGLRFRSSSTAEDVEGFSGAGLYDSNTGYLAATSDHDFEWAIKKTWASYWSWEAFEERRMAQIEHLDGNMAVLVHARFDDALERSNGVLTLTVDRAHRSAQASGQAYASMELNVQIGALSVTNPPPELAGVALPEVVRARQAQPGARVEIERVAGSTQLPSGRVMVLDDAQIERLFEAAVQSAERFLDIDNLNLDPARARRRVTLDIEFREVAQAWPARASGPPAPARMIIKQLRSLDPGIPPGAEALLAQPIPRELVLFADRIEHRSCRGARVRFDVIEVWTDPMANPDLGHARAPFVSRVRVQSRGLPGGSLRLDLDHHQLRSVARPGMDRSGAWALALEFEPGDAGLDALEFSAGRLQLRAGSTLLGTEPSSCTTEVLFASPDGFLRGLIGR